MVLGQSIRHSSRPKPLTASLSLALNRPATLNYSLHRRLFMDQSNAFGACFARLIKIYFLVLILISLIGFTAKNRFGEANNFHKRA